MAEQIRDYEGRIDPEAGAVHMGMDCWMQPPETVAELLERYGPHDWINRAVAQLLTKEMGAIVRESDGFATLWLDTLSAFEPVLNLGKDWPSYPDAEIKHIDAIAMAADYVP